MSKSKYLQDMYNRHHDGLKESEYTDKAKICEFRQNQYYDGLLESVRQVDNFTKPTNEQQVVYKLRHKHTGLYFHPKGAYQTVSKLGKVYSNRRPARQSHITIPYDIRDEYNSQFHNAQTKLDDWEVISYTLTEIKE